MTQIPHDLMTAILDNTASDLPRLIVADWLEEHGDSELSEFIRVQIEFAKHPHYQHITTKNYDARDGVNEEWQRGFDLEKRNKELSNHCIDWFSLPKSNDATSVSWSRGFPSSVRCTIADFMPGECEKCNGKGVLAGYPNALSFSSCGPCHGTGKSPFLAAVIGGWPVREIRFSDVGIINQNTGTFDSPEWVPFRASRIANGVPTGPTPKWLMVCKSIEEISDAAVRHARGEWERHAQPSRADAGKGDPEAGEHGDGKMKTPRVANGNATRG